MGVSDKQSVKSYFAKFEKDGEKIDICVNNAGIAILTPIFQEDDNDNFESIVQTNLMGIWYVTKAVANHIKNHGVYGLIINIGSVNGDAIPAKCGAAYSVSKSSVIHLTKTLFGELSLHKIKINCVSPIWTRTPMNGPYLEQIIPLIPYEDIAEPTNLDGLILYLASNNASKYLTGSSFIIDSGIS